VLPEMTRKLMQMSQPQVWIRRTAGQKEEEKNMSSIICSSELISVSFRESSHHKTLEEKQDNRFVEPVLGCRSFVSFLLVIKRHQV
jgi:hypothetical protein